MFTANNRLAPILSFVVMAAFTSALTGCATTVENHNAIADTKLSVNYIGTERTINAPFAVVKSRMLKLVEKCGTSTVTDTDPRIINKSAATVQFQYKIVDDTPNSFVILNTIATAQSPSDVRVLVRVQFDKIDANTTKATSQHNNIPFLGGHDRARNNILQWAKGEHEFCY